MPTEQPADQPAHTRHTREVYDRLAPAWSSTTDDGPFNGGLERPALRTLIPKPLAGASVLDAGCGSGAQCEWLLDAGADVIGVDVSPRMIEEAERRCAGRGRFLVGDLSEPLPIEPLLDQGGVRRPLDGITSSLALHYVRDWSVPLRSFASALRPGGWVVLSSDHPFGAALPGQQGGYFDTELVSDTWGKGGIEVTQHFWRRPLSDTLAAFADAGFVVERVSEPQPSAEALARWPRELAGVVGVPIFIVYRLRLVEPAARD